MLLIESGSFCQGVQINDRTINELMLISKIIILIHISIVIL
jgi:hypothetical protein